MSDKAEPSNKASKAAAGQSLAKTLSKARSNGSLRSNVRAGTSATNDSSVDKRRSNISALRTGSWRGKAAAVAGLTQSISAAASTAADQVHNQLPFSAIAAPPFASLRRPRKSAPSIAPPLCLNVTADAQEEIKHLQVQPVRGEKEASVEQSDIHQSTSPITGTGDNDRTGIESANDTGTERPLPQTGWGGWWTRPTVQNPKDGVDTERTPTAEISDSMINNASPGVASHSRTTAQDVPLPAVSQEEEEQLRDTSKSKQNRNSWFGLWGGAQDTKPAQGEERVQHPRRGSPAALDPIQSNEQALAGASTSENTMQPPHASDIASLPVRGSGSWAFWSREQPQPGSTNTSTNSKAEVGELAVAKALPTNSALTPQIGEQAKIAQPGKGKGKQQNPVIKNDATLLNTAKTSKPSETEPKRKVLHQSTASSGSSRNSTKSFTSAAIYESVSEGQVADITKAAAIEETTGSVSGASTTPAEKKISTRKIQPHPNLVLPSFSNTYEVVETPTYWQQITQMMGYTQEPARTHIAKAPAPPHFKHALAIGVHGLFPAPIVQKVLGQPTGTSMKFANEAATAIQKWTTKQGFSCEIEKVALEGEGLVADRVDTLWQLLLNWLDNIRKADFIMVACHSQGVPVAVMLMAKLINLGCLNPSARLGICAMAGVSLGPFPSYIGKMFGAAAIELFSFSLPKSTVSAAYLTSLRNCLAHHVRITYTGALNDQLVSLESAMFATISHPYIYRAVYVDGRVHAPDFLVKLIALALKLRNLGLSDHGLIRELSASVAGTLMASDGHSRVYQEDAVYDMAVEFTLGTTTLPGKDVGELLEVKVGYEVPGASGATNPYILPWAVRGVLEEKVVKEGPLRGEAEELLKLFEEWNPTTKVLKDVKFRLEAVRSQL